MNDLGASAGRKLIECRTWSQCWKEADSMKDLESVLEGS